MTCLHVPLRDGYLLDLFGGVTGPVSAAAKKYGVFGYLFDMARDAKYDATSIQFARRIRRDIRRRLCRGAMIATPCATFSSANRWHWRTPEHPEGCPWLAEHALLKVALGNACAEATVDVAYELYLQKRPFIIENPHRSWLWSTKRMQWLLSLPGVRTAVLDQCMYGSRWRKRTMLVMFGIDNRDERRLTRTCSSHRGCCDRTGLKHVHLIDGKLTSAAACYPRELADCLAFVLASAMRKQRVLARG